LRIIYFLSGLFVADVQYSGCFTARRPRLLPALWELRVACVCARKRLPPITFRLHETIGCFIASDYVSKRPTRNNRHVLAAQKRGFVDYHCPHMRAAVSHQLLHRAPQRALLVLE
jgi:hypothetical protein